MSRKALLVLAAFWCATPLVHAQSGQVYWGGGAYPPTLPNSAPPAVYYGYPNQGVQPVQYPMGQFNPYPYHRPPTYNYPQQYPQQPIAYNNGYGVNYYQMTEPAPYSATPAPYSAVANSRAIGMPIGWPNAPGPVVVDDEYRVDDGSGYTDIRRPLPPVPYHRETNEHVFGSLDYVGMFLRPMRFSGPVATTGSVADAAPGAIGQPGTRVLYGQDAADFGLMSGLRAQLGMFLDSNDHYSLDLGGFWVFRGSQSFSTRSDGNGNPSISRPIVNIVNGTEGAFINSLPGFAAGTLNVDLHSEIGGFELNARRHWYFNERVHVDALVGFRYLRLAENMQISESLATIAPKFVTFNQAPIGIGSTLLDSDSFETINQFFGPQIGGRVSWEQKWFTASAYAKLGLGVTNQFTSIAGSTTALYANGTQSTAAGGILALPTNIGHHSRTVFGILPELGLNLGVELTQCVRLNLGYSILMWNHVVRPGGQFDRNINPSLAPSTPGPIVVGGAQGPIYRFNDEFFWAQSFNVGLEFHY